MATKAKTNGRDLQLAKHIQKIRKEQGYTQEKLADKLGISLTHYGYLEIGYKIPNMHMLQKIADALGVKVKDLIPY
jgi:transcriptional regulator with XRE-family HTH domain